MTKWYSLQGPSEPVPLAGRVKSFKGKHVSENERISLMDLIKCEKKLLSIHCLVIVEKYFYLTSLYRPTLLRRVIFLSICCL